MNSEDLEEHYENFKILKDSVNFLKHSKLLIKIYEFFPPNTLNKTHPIQRILNMLHNKSISLTSTIDSLSFNYQ